MNRSGTSRAPSPTGTTFSGISNYRTDSYRPIRDKNVPAMPSMDPRRIANIHFQELSRYLAEYLAAEPANSRSSARQKLTRLTRQQFQELSTDVYDELMRRRQNNSGQNEAVPFLPVRDDFHPKRNQARQKLATLPTSRFQDLSSDVYYELSRRYPEFKEEPSPGSTYDDYPSPDFPTSPRSKGGTPSVSSRRKPSQDAGRSIRRPSQDTTMNEYGRRPSGSVSTTSERSDPQSATATSGVVIPNKSTIAEEEIEVPYGREGRDSSSTAMDERERERSRDVDTDGVTDGETDDPGPRSPPGIGLGGLSGLTARLRDADEDEEEETVSRGGKEDYYDRMSFGRASVASDRSAGGRAGREDEERIRREYEYKIATMQNRITGLERELESSGGEDRVRQMEGELDQLRRRAEEQATTILALQRELRELREDRAREKDMEARRAREDEEELHILRERCERLEEERANGGGGGADPEIIDQLRADMEGLMAELTDLSRRNDELMNAKDSDLAVIRDLDAQVKEYKRKYEQAKTELRSVKATSQLFLPTPKTDDQLPTSSDGGLLDIHVTAFVSSIDNLLKEGRSNAPTRVLMPMKAVVNAVSAIVDDVRAFERRPSQDRDRMEVDMEALRALRERAEATLSNLVAATKTHATSNGMAPVSLLDAAASHVSATVTEIGKTIYIRKASKAEMEQFNPASSSSGAATNGFSPALRSVEENRMHGRAGSSSSSRREYASSPPPIFDQPNSAGVGPVGSDESAAPDGSEDAWAELKPYLEAQTESIVYAIQSVLSGVRSPTPSPTLNENLTQIITIVSSIVAVCKDNLPPGSAQQGADIISELSDHANKLSEVQAQPEVTKESRQIMAKSSFAVANAMKALMKLA
ncbi:hypothetical protein GLOTRDRAFT_76278 [Gloeophyllum trabeum ATCC 11539]|uniref:GIT Spa2 homology (SHD) domain-containing protein n=1 Tax=Gloeophyllum trabeum (strain ATCC 11539 / FP-39264 / Madison 617) TaxID=670483 RepID=S7RKV1_GLOTA|nr:uncharacterized protein GLOTRDRAFT_76278 [Gloeophyllum trabeum ATCC 11539]EPQ54975.1 hypothetical protein GLOTRDRAFT_76278 [Gloeophyllum trabeum ATCC 11539]